MNHWTTTIITIILLFSMGRLDTERQAQLEPKRMEATKKALEEMGFEVIENGDTELQFNFKGHTVYFFPYSGWHSGKTIKDGRGFFKLKKQLENNEN